MIRSRARLVSPGSVSPAQLDDLLTRHAVSSVFVGEHVDTLLAGRRRRTVPVLGVLDADRRLTGACWVGTNVVPVALDETGQDLVAEYLMRGVARFASIFGPARPVMGLWERLRGSWPEPFDVRPDQPLLAMDRSPGPELLSGIARGVRWGTEEDFPHILPASAAMFEEEVGYSPFSGGAEGYRGRVRNLLRQERTILLMGEHDEVVFKADIGSVSRGVCQIQGVWMNPRYRGRGMAAPCMAAVVEMARRKAPVITLYVNAFNHRAVATYRRVGFSQSDVFATVLL